MFILLCFSWQAMQWRDEYQATGAQLNTYRDIDIGASRQEVRYIMGDPTVVLGEPFKAGWRMVYQVDGKDAVNAMPKGTDINSYSIWQWTPSVSALHYWSVTFDTSGKVSEIECHENGTEGDCRELFDIGMNDYEFEAIKKLGQPSSQKLENGVKTMAWDGFGVRLQLERQQVFGIIKTKPTLTAWQAFQKINEGH